MGEYVVRSGKAGRADYTPYGVVRDAFLNHDHELILAGPRDTGKTLGLLYKLHVTALKYPGASIVIARSQLTDVYSTALVTYQKRVLKRGDPVHVFGGERPQWFDYHNGSRIWVAGLDSPGKVLSAEHDIIYVNQAEELALVDWEALLGSASGRAGNVPYAQVCGDCNPASPSHWIKSRARSTMNPDGPLTLLESNHRDNPELFDPDTGLITQKGELRLGVLKTLTGTRRQRWYDGLWVAPEGVIYSAFDQTRHIVTAFPIPSLWPRLVGIDPVGAYVAAVWLGVDMRERKIHVYREYLRPYGVPTREHVASILRLTGFNPQGHPLSVGSGESVFSWVCGAPSERQWRLDYMAYGLPVSPPGVGDVWAGIDRVNALLQEGSLVIHDSCPHLIAEIGEYRRKLGRDGLPSETIDSKDKFHLLDALRYALVGPEGGGIETEYVYTPTLIGPQW